LLWDSERNTPVSAHSFSPCVVRNICIRIIMLCSSLAVTQIPKKPTFNRFVDYFIYKVGLAAALWWRNPTFGDTPLVLGYAAKNAANPIRTRTGNPSRTASPGAWYFHFWKSPNCLTLAPSSSHWAKGFFTLCNFINALTYSSNVIIDCLRNKHDTPAPFAFKSIR